MSRHLAGSDRLHGIRNGQYANSHAAAEKSAQLLMEPGRLDQFTGRKLCMRSSQLMERFATALTNRYINRSSLRVLRDMIIAFPLAKVRIRGPFRPAHKTYSPWLLYYCKSPIERNGQLAAVPVQHSRSRPLFDYHKHVPDRW